MVGVEKLLKDSQLINKEDIVGVACSGGADSMSLLHYLNSVKNEYGFSVVAITIDHGIRENSDKDANFVVSYCKKNDIEVHRFKGEVPALSKENAQTIEQAAREYRFKVFAEMLAKKKVTKIALGHHMQDQAETILLNIFRGSGLQGASGMDVVRDGVYLRPLLKTSKAEIMAYINANEIPYVEDETNYSNDYARNFIRNSIMPLVRNKWKNADQTICSFGETCKQDDDYILNTINDDLVVYEASGAVKVPVTYFVYNDSVINRIILKAVKNIGVFADVERKHISLIKTLALEAENGKRINLPNKLSVIKEYNYVTITNKDYKPVNQSWEFKLGKIDVSQYGVIEIRKTKSFKLNEYTHLIDIKKVPKDAQWRYKDDGDMFEKFGGGTKSLNDYLTDKKVPRRLREYLPVLASGKEILVVAGFEISDKVKLDENTKLAYGITAVPFN